MHKALGLIAGVTKQDENQRLTQYLLFMVHTLSNFLKMDVHCRADGYIHLYLN